MNCPACGSSVKKLGIKCPNCGTFVPDPYKITFPELFSPNKMSLHKDFLAIIIFILLMLVSIIFC